MVDNIPKAATAIILSLQFHGSYDPLLRDMMLDVFTDAKRVVVHVYHWISQQEINLAYQYLNNFRLYAIRHSWRGVPYEMKNIFLSAEGLRLIDWPSMLEDPNKFISLFSRYNKMNGSHTTYTNSFYIAHKSDLELTPTGGDVA